MLLGCGQRRPQLLHLELERRRIDLEQNVTKLYRHVRLDRNGHDLAAHIRRHLDDPPGHGDFAGWR